MSSQKLVTEFHYQDGDVGVHPADRPEKDLWRGFSPISHPCHIVIRPDTPEGQKLSNILRAAPEMCEALRQLREWASYVGGWESPVWSNAFELLDEIDGVNDE